MASKRKADEVAVHGIDTEPQTTADMAELLRANKDLITNGTRLEQALSNLMIELDIVGNALIPGGLSSKVVPPAGWGRG